jgi:hypothetical protein
MIAFFGRDSGEMLDMKNLLLSLPVKSIANKLRHATTLLLPGFILLIGHSACAEQGQPTRTNGTPVAPQNCGAVALAQLAHILQSGTKLEEKILNTPAPQGGFNLADLRGLGAANGMKLEAVRAPTGAALPVPCIVHLEDWPFRSDRGKEGLELSNSEQAVWRRHLGGLADDGDIRERGCPRAGGFGRA